MNFDFSEDQRRLQEEVRKVLADHSTSTNVRRVLDGEALYCAATWKALAEVGALGVAIPEAQGGAGMGLLELCLIAEEAGRALAAIPLLSSIYMAAETIRRAGSEAQQATWLPRLAAGELIAAAMLAPASEQVLAGPAPTLDSDRLTATFNAVPDGMSAGLAVLLVGDAVVLLDLNADGVARNTQASIDPTRPLARIRCDQAPVEVLTATGGAALAESVTDGAAVLLAFEQVGGAEAALYAARDYAQQRKAFGRLIGSFQAVKHKLADIYVALELARAHAYFGAWALATGADALPRAAAAARVAATEAYTLAAEESLHLHGGIGYTWEVDCHLHLRRARWIGQIIGSKFMWTDRLADSLIAEAA